MKKLSGAGAAFLLSAAMILSPASAAFAAGSLTGASSQKVTRIDARDLVRSQQAAAGISLGFGLDPVYSDSADSQLFAAKIDKILAGCKKAAGNGTRSISEIQKEIDSVTRILKNINKFKKTLKADASGSRGSADILARVSYAQARVKKCRSDLKKELAKAQKLAAEQAAAAKTAQDYRQAEPETQAPETQVPETETPETTAPETEVPETEAPETETPETEVPETEAPETDAPETEAPETDAPETETPETDAPESEAPETEAAQAEDSYEDDSEDTGDYQETEADSEDTGDYQETEAEADSSDDENSSSTGSSSSSWRWPVSSRNITSGYGGREAPTEGASTNHMGLDIAADEGSDIYSATSGTVSKSGYNDAMGNYVVVDRGDGYSTIYEHCSDIYASEGDSVSAGDTIAAVGSTGIATGSHLHFGVTYNGDYVDPGDYDYSDE